MINEIDFDVERKVYRPIGEIRAHLLLAHGAGAGNRHEFMESLAREIAGNGIQVTSFNFPYMQLVYEQNKKRPPNKLALLQEHFSTELNLLKESDEELPIFVAGKSMGGRIATLISTHPEVVQSLSGVIVFGYPFIPPGKPEKLEERVKHFDEIKVRSLILQGERDTFGSLSTLDSLKTYKNIKIDWIKSGDHSFKPLKSTGLTQEENIETAAARTVNFILANI